MQNVFEDFFMSKKGSSVFAMIIFANVNLYFLCSTNIFSKAQDIWRHCRHKTQDLNEGNEEKASYYSIQKDKIVHQILITTYRNPCRGVIDLI